MPGHDRTGPQGNGPRTGRGLVTTRGDDQAHNLTGEFCQRRRRRQRMGDVCEERSYGRRRGDMESGRGFSARQNMQGKRGMKRGNHFQGKGRNRMGQQTLD